MIRPPLPDNKQEAEGDEPSDDGGGDHDDDDHDNVESSFVDGPIHLVAVGAPSPSFGSKAAITTPITSRGTSTRPAVQLAGAPSSSLSPIRVTHQAGRPRRGPGSSSSNNNISSVRRREIVVEVGSGPHAADECHDDDDDDDDAPRRPLSYIDSRRQLQQQQPPASPVVRAGRADADRESTNAYSPSWGLRFAPHRRTEPTDRRVTAALAEVRSRHHACAHLAVQQVLRIERHRRGKVPLPISQPKTAEQFYQWLTLSSASASKPSSATTSHSNTNRRTNEKEYPLGLQNDTHAGRPRREITVAPARAEDDVDDRWGEGSDVGSDWDQSAYTEDDAHGETSDDSDDEGSAVAVATMMTKMPAVEKTRSQKSAGPSGSAKAPSPQNESTQAWREASRIVSECHARMVSVQENSKLRQQQLRLHNEHLQLLLESSRVTIEQLQMRLIFSSHTKASQSQPKSGSSSAETPDPRPRPSLEDVRGHVEALVAHQQAILNENAALKQSLLQCGCDRCLERYRDHQRAAAAGAQGTLDSAGPSQHGASVADSKTYAEELGPVASSLVTNDIPMPSIVPTEGSSSSSSSTSSRHPSRASTSGLPAADDDCTCRNAILAAEEEVRDVKDSKSVLGRPTVPLGEGDDDDESFGVGDDDESIHRSTFDEARVDHQRSLEKCDEEVPRTADDAVVERRRMRSGKHSWRRSRASSSGPSLGEYLTTQQEDGNTTSGSLAEHEYDRLYSRGLAESVSVLSSMSRITFRTIDEDITVDCSTMNDEGTSGVQDSTARLDASEDMSLLPIELTESERERHHTSMESSSDVPPPRRSLAESASSITTSLSNDDPSFRLSSRSGELTVRNSNLQGIPEIPTAMDATDVRVGLPSRRGRKPPRTNHHTLRSYKVDVSLDQVYSLADPSTIMDPAVLAPFVNPLPSHERSESLGRPPAPPMTDGASDAVPTAPEGWQHKYVSSDDLYSSAVMNAMEKRKKGAASSARHARDSHPDRFVAELSKCLQGGSSHSTVSDSLAPAPEQALTSSKEAAVAPVAAARPDPLPLSYDDAIMAAMSHAG